MTTPLAALLAARIAAVGPIGLDTYMAECLTHPLHGYYTARDPLGAAGDFTTAPEISQMFGELLGLALAQAWLDQGAPAPFALAETGPGRGTLMADVWRATARVPGFHAAARLCLIEVSPPLRAVQAARLAEALPRWFDRPDDLPELPLFLVANEFFDALPIRQFQHTPEGWRERVVGLRDGAPALGLSPPLPCPDPRFAADLPGTVVELCPGLPGFCAPLAARIAAHGGAAIVVDYGGWRSKGDTLQAVAGHAFADPLAAPGQADLTAHVDFEALALAFAPCAATAMVTQRALLERLGIGQRSSRLAAGLAGGALSAHVAATRRLTDPDEMGSLFKAIGFHPPGVTPPPGFA
ncbi:MAG TPA: SAM-dependent methyltransferase [Paracoccaceae bacterium]|nr:SAM-dependent methyltransferase [Paracoccaceae bacterium]